MAYEALKRKSTDNTPPALLVARLAENGHTQRQGLGSQRGTGTSLDAKATPRHSFPLRHSESHRVLAESARSLYAVRSSVSSSLPNLQAKLTPRQRAPVPAETEAVVPTGSVRVAIRTETGSVRRVTKQSNQDTAFAVEIRGWYLLGVCDGHGLQGHFVSNSLKANFPKSIFEAIHCQDHQRPADLPVLALKYAYGRAARTLRESNIDCSNSGSTCVTVLIHENTVTCGNVGDSRAVLGRKRSGLWISVPLSVDHKPELRAEYDRIVRAGGEVSISKVMHSGPPRVYLKGAQFPGLAMSRSMGDDFAKGLGVTSDPDLTTTHLSKDDQFLILASDGVWEFLTNLEAVQIVGEFAEERDPGKGASALVREAQRRWTALDGGMVDDITAIVAYLSP